MSAKRTLDEAKLAIITVGDGRGFVVSNRRVLPATTRLVITAGHCLPSFPPCESISYSEDRIYKALLGSLGETPKVCAECLFADPIADIAVLGPPDDQNLPDEADAYERLMDSAAPLPIADAPQNGRAWLLSLDGRWFACDVRHDDGPLWISNATESIVGGTVRIAHSRDRRLCDRGAVRRS